MCHQIFELLVLLLIFKCSCILPPDLNFNTQIIKEDRTSWRTETLETNLLPYDS